jgi:hypothetical protein
MSNVPQDVKDLIRDICEMPEPDDSARTVVVDLDWLEGKLVELLRAQRQQGAEPVVWEDKDGWLVFRRDILPLLESTAKHNTVDLGRAIPASWKPILYTTPPQANNSTEDRNLDGAGEFVKAIISGDSVWPNSWGQDVVFAAFVITDGGQRHYAVEPDANALVAAAYRKAADRWKTGLWRYGFHNEDFGMHDDGPYVLLSQVEKALAAAIHADAEAALRERDHAMCMKVAKIASEHVGWNEYDGVVLPTDKDLEAIVNSVLGEDGK